MKKAYVTILSTDSYLQGVLALFESLKNTKPNVNNFIVVINEKISKEAIEILNEKGYITIEKKSISIPESIKNINSIGTSSNWSYTFDKFNLFELEEFDKIVYLDSDMYVNKNIDELFDKPNMSGVVAGKSYPGNETWKELNSGIMVIEPKKGIKDKLIETMLKMSMYNKKMGDQDIIEEYYHWKDKPELKLDERYNIFSKHLDYYINEKKYLKEDIAVVHFIGSKKPWMLNEKEIEEYEENCKKQNNKYQLEFFRKYMELLRRENKVDNC